MFGCMQSSIDSISALSIPVLTLFFLQPFMKALKVVSQRFLGMARQRDTAELNLNANKGTLLFTIFFIFKYKFSSSNTRFFFCL